MKKYTNEEVKNIIEEHRKWLNDEGGQRADLSYADLRCADLSRADLRYANLSCADLSSADLSRADLRCANLNHADLSYADLRSADLSYASLHYASLSYADLHYADLHYAILNYADLSYADLHYANLNHVNLSYIKNLSFPIACPEEGSFVAWKKAKDDLIIKLLVLEDAKRSSSTGRKCRCDKAKVLEIQNLCGGKADVECAKSKYDESFIYKTGEIVTVTNFNDDRWRECASGIHFFITRKEAEDY